MCIVDLLCAMGFCITGTLCFKLHSNDNSKVIPVDDMPRKATPYELQMYAAHLNLYGKQN